MKKSFPTLAVLSVTSGRLLTVPRTPDEGNGIGQIYEVLNFMCEDNLFTHQLPRAANQAKPYILQQYPKLEELNITIDTMCKNKEVKECQALMLQTLGNEIELTPIPPDEYQGKHPLVELAEMVGEQNEK